MDELNLFFQNDFILFDLKPLGALLGFLNVDLKILLIQTHLLIQFYESESLTIKSLIREITKAKNVLEKISVNNEKKHTMHKRKWQHANWKYFEDQNFMTLYLIQPLSQGGWEGGAGEVGFQ